MSERDDRKLSLPLDRYLESEPRPGLEDVVWAKLKVRRSALPPTAREACLPVPVGELLVDEGELTGKRARLWRGVRGRLNRPRRRLLPRKATLLLAAGFGACVAFALVVLTWRPSEPLAGRGRSPISVEATRRDGALLAADGRPPGVLDASTEPQTLRLSDKSEIRLARGAHLEPVLSTSSRFELLLARGSAEFSVTPGGPRRWAIDTGTVRVEVVGTVFRVTREEDRVEVAVARGVVLVIGEDVPGRVRKLAAGDSLSVSARAAAAPTATSADEPVSASTPVTDHPTPGSSGAHARSNGTAARARGAHELQKARHEADPSLNGLLVRSALQARKRADETTLRSASAHAGASSPQERYAQLGPTGLARATAQATSIEELLDLADVARLSGHPQDAIAPLTRSLDKFRGSSQAALAAFTLGRVLLDQLSVAAPAAEAFERSIALGLPKALRADCYRRLAEAYGRAGNEPARARAEARFQTEFALPSSSLDKVAP
jgi:transmembrane sensor